MKKIALFALTALMIAPALRAQMSSVPTESMGSHIKTPAMKAHSKTPAMKAHSEQAQACILEAQKGPQSSEPKPGGGGR